VSNSVLLMLHEWHLRLREIVPQTREQLSKQLKLPDAADVDSLKRLGLTRIEFSPRGSWIEVTFLDPISLDDIKAVFGEWTTGTRGPGLASERPYYYWTNGIFSTKFTFFGRPKLIIDPVTGASSHTIFSSQLLVAMGEPPKPTFQENPVKPPPVSRWRRWFRRGPND
jgi:hypothetical protein